MLHTDLSSLTFSTENRSGRKVAAMNKGKKRERDQFPFSVGLCMYYLWCSCLQTVNLSVKILLHYYSALSCRSQGWVYATEACMLFSPCNQIKVQQPSAWWSSVCQHGLLLHLGDLLDLCGIQGYEDVQMQCESLLSGGSVSHSGFSAEFSEHLWKLTSVFLEHRGRRFLMLSLVHLAGTLWRSTVSWSSPGYWIAACCCGHVPCASWGEVSDRAEAQPILGDRGQWALGGLLLNF